MGLPCAIWPPETPEEFTRRPAGYWVAHLRPDLHEWLEDESPLAEPRMWNREIGLLADGVAEQDQVEIQRPRRPGMGPLPARFTFNRQQLAQQRPRIECRLPERDRVQKTRLRTRHADGIG